MLEPEIVGDALNDTRCDDLIKGARITLETHDINLQWPPTRASALVYDNMQYPRIIVAIEQPNREDWVNVDGTFVPVAGGQWQLISYTITWPHAPRSMIEVR